MEYGNAIIKYLTTSELTISSDAITITQGNHKLQPQSGTADNLSTINGTFDGQFGVLYVSDFGIDTITIKHNVGNILCVSGADITLSNGCVFWYSNGTKIFVSGDGGAAASGGDTVRTKYVITPSIASNNLTIALKYIDDTDPSTTKKLTFRVGNTEYDLTAAMSYTKNAGTNWHNSGSSELATQDIDYFVYAIGETGASAGLKFGHSRIPYAQTMGDFVNTTTNEKYIAGNWTNFNASDPVTVIGRFRAALSGSASFNWSIPNAKVINHPIYKTDRLTYAPTWVGWITPPTAVAYYIVDYSTCFIYTLPSGSATSNSTSTNMTLPFTCATITSLLVRNTTSGQDNGTLGAIPAMATITSADNKIVFYKDFSAAAWTASGNKQVFSTEIHFPLN